MTLFLSYINKCKLRSGYATQAESLQKILESEAIDTILSWEDVYRLSDQYQVWDMKSRNSGCAFKKIGRMLQGLGVIGHSEEEGSNNKYLNKLKSEIDTGNRKWAMSILNMLEKRRRSIRTRAIWLKEIRNLEIWLSKRQSCPRLECVTQDTAREYLAFKKENFSPNQLYSNLCLLKKLYRWGVGEKFVLVNPFESLIASKPEPKIRHCSENDMRKLFDYVKNENSDPESAMIIVLVMFFGVSCEQMIHSQIAIHKEDTFHLILRNKQATCVTRNKREQLVKFPNEPQWLISLQQRYVLMWRDRYSKISKLYDSRPFLLPHNNWYAIALNSRIVYKRIKKATKLALDGPSVPYTILKNTCGIINTHCDDASILAKLGWSSKHAFKYIYQQREIYLPR